MENVLIVRWLDVLSNRKLEAVLTALSSMCYLEDNVSRRSLDVIDIRQQEIAKPAMISTNSLIVTAYLDCT